MSKSKQLLGPAMTETRVSVREVSSDHGQLRWCTHPALPAHRRRGVGPDAAAGAGGHAVAPGAAGVRAGRGGATPGHRPGAAKKRVSGTGVTVARPAQRVLKRIAAAYCHRTTLWCFLLVTDCSGHLQRPAVPRGDLLGPHRPRHASHQNGPRRLFWAGGSSKSPSYSSKHASTSSVTAFSFRTTSLHQAPAMYCLWRLVREVPASTPLCCCP